MTEYRLYEHFSPEELACRCGKCGLGQKNMSPSFMDKIEYLRVLSGIKMPVTSAVRCHNYNREVSKVKAFPPHTVIQLNKIDKGKPFCHALDINIWGDELNELLKHIYNIKKYGIVFTGIGLNQKGPYNKRFLHIDDLPANIEKNIKIKRPWVWTY